MIPPQITLQGLATTSLLVSLLIAAFMPLRSLLRRAVGSQWLCLLWLALLVRLLIPLSLESRWSLLRPWQNQAAPPAATRAQWKTKLITDENSAPRNAPAATGAPVVRASPPSRTALSPGTVLNILWLSGAGAGLCILAWRWHQTRRLAARTQPATDERLLHIFSSIPQKWRRNVRLRMTEALQVPTLAGVLRPEIWMPLSWPARFTDEELRNVLLHELGHARRGDLLAQWLFAFAQCIHWFNPLIWLAARAARFDREMACDAWVLARSGVDNAGYGDALMKTVQLLREPLRATHAAVAMASRRRNLFTRISGIGAFQPLPAWRGALGTAAMLAALAALTTTRTTAEDAPAAAAPAAASATPVPASMPDTAGRWGVRLEAKFVEITEDAWKKLCTENPAFKDYNSKFPELAREKPSYAALKDLLTKPEKGAWEIPGDISQLALLSNDELVSMIKSVSQEKGVDLLSAPGVVTKDGMRAVVEITRAFHYPAEYEENKNYYKPVETTNSAGEKQTVLLPRFSPTAFTPKNIGVTLQAQPKINKDGTIKLNLVPTLASLIGFLSDKEGVKTLTPELQDVWAAQNRPVFSTSTGKFAVTAQSGQTVLLAGVRLDCNTSSMMDDINPPENATPPPAAVASETVRHILLIFVTSSIVELNQPARPSPSPAAQPSPVPNVDSKVPYAVPVDGKPGYVTSPYAPDAGVIDVNGYPPGTEVKDPYTGKTFLVP